MCVTARIEPLSGKLHWWNDAKPIMRTLAEEEELGLFLALSAGHIEAKRSLART